MLAMTEAMITLPKNVAVLGIVSYSDAPFVNTK